MARKSVIIVVAILISVICLEALGQVKFNIQDLNYGGKPFNPGDVACVHRVRLSDKYDTNKWDVFLTKIAVENVGNATNNEIAWLEVRLEVGGETNVLVHSTGFPISQMLLPLPPDQRSVPDDEDAVLTVWMKAGDNLTEGHTIQTRIHLWYSEGSEGAETTVLDAVAETLVMSIIFDAQVLTSPLGGILNPGDEFPVLQVKAADTADANFDGLKLVRVRVDGPSNLEWTVGTQTQRVKLSVGREVVLEDPIFVAFDEEEGSITLWAKVPSHLRPKELLIVDPSVTLVIQEGAQENSFQYTDPSPDTVLAGGVENFSVDVPQGGEVLTSVPSTLAYSTVTLSDRDRNDTRVRVDSIALTALGTVFHQIQGIEIANTQGSVLGFRNGLGNIALLQPDGNPISIPDDGEISFGIQLYLVGPMPLGASLLIAHQFDIDETNPYGEEGTHFSGVQKAEPEKAIFFGKPIIELRAVPNNAEPWTGSIELSTDGETVGTIEAVIHYTPSQSIAITGVSAETSYRIVSQEVNSQNGTIPVSIKLGGGQAKTGQFLKVLFELLEGVESPITVTARLEVISLLDTAGLELPYSIRPETVNLTLTALSPPPEESVSAQPEEPGVTPNGQEFGLKTSYAEGEPLQIAFRLLDPVTGSPITNATVTLSIVRIISGEPQETVYFGTIPFDQKRGMYALDYDAADLTPGSYDLYIGASTGQTYKVHIEVRAP
jgi:hypothetical protein